MSFQEKSIVCSDCGTAFAFTAEEQEFYQSKGFTNTPKRCPSCRTARKSQQGSREYQNNRGNFGTSTRRQMFPVKCSQCGKDTQVPFEPRNGRPVYCSDCYDTVRTGR
jgi:CxxC-x17-CxxC domain-containing protein